MSQRGAGSKKMRPKSKTSKYKGKVKQEAEAMIKKEEFYIVEAIAEVKKVKENEFRFLVQWSGWSKEFNSWQERADFANDGSLLSFLSQYVSKKSLSEEQKTLSLEAIDLLTENLVQMQETREEILVESSNKGQLDSKNEKHTQLELESFWSKPKRPKKDSESSEKWEPKSKNRKKSRQVKEKENEKKSKGREEPEIQEKGTEVRNEEEKAQGKKTSCSNGPGSQQEFHWKPWGNEEVGGLSQNESANENQTFKAVIIEEIPNEISYKDKNQENTQIQTKKSLEKLAKEPKSSKNATTVKVFDGTSRKKTGLLLEGTPAKESSGKGSLSKSTFEERFDAIIKRPSAPHQNETVEDDQDSLPAAQALDEDFVRETKKHLSSKKNSRNQSLVMEVESLQLEPYESKKDKETSKFLKQNASIIEENLARKQEDISKKFSSSNKQTPIDKNPMSSLYGTGPKPHSSDVSPIGKQKWAPDSKRNREVHELSISHETLKENQVENKKNSGELLKSSDLPKTRQLEPEETEEPKCIFNQTRNQAQTRELGRIFSRGNQVICEIKGEFQMEQVTLGKLVSDYPEMLKEFERRLARFWQNMEDASRLLLQDE